MDEITPLLWWLEVINFLRAGALQKCVYMALQEPQRPATGFPAKVVLKEGRAGRFVARARARFTSAQPEPSSRAAGGGWGNGVSEGAFRAEGTELRAGHARRSRRRRTWTLTALSSRPGDSVKELRGGTEAGWSDSSSLERDAETPATAACRWGSSGSVS